MDKSENFGARTGVGADSEHLVLLYGGERLITSKGIATGVSSIGEALVGIPVNGHRTAMLNVRLSTMAANKMKPLMEATVEMRRRAIVVVQLLQVH